MRLVCSLLCSLLVQGPLAHLSTKVVPLHLRMAGPTAILGTLAAPALPTLPAPSDSGRPPPAGSASVVAFRLGGMRDSGRCELSRAAVKSSDAVKNPLTNSPSVPLLHYCHAWLGGGIFCRTSKLHRYRAGLGGGFFRVDFASDEFRTGS